MQIFLMILLFFVGVVITRYGVLLLIDALRTPKKQRNLMEFFFVVFEFGFLISCIGVSLTTFSCYKLIILL